MFFVVGSTLEYAKHAEYIVAGITLLLGLLKTYVSYHYYLELDWLRLLCSELPILGGVRWYRANWGAWGHHVNLGHPSLCFDDNFRDHTSKVVQSGSALTGLCNCIISYLFRASGSLMSPWLTCLMSLLQRMSTSMSSRASSWSYSVYSYWCITG
jgi:hypothetical protein